ncbi:MAG: S1 family peptidase [Chloroflexi bacterium]|nr:S1 family peptidase [Chloroflexota bacterium]
MSTLLIGAALGTIQAGAIDVVSADDGETLDDRGGGVRQVGSEAFDADISLLAKETGLSLAVVEASVRFQDQFADYAEQVLERYPGEISGIWTEALPSARGHIRFTASTPTDFASVIAPGGLDIVVAEGGAMSLEEQHERASVVFDALVGKGHRNVVTFYSPDENVIRVELQLPAGSSQPTAAELANTVQAFQDSGMPGQLSSPAWLKGRAAEFRASDLAVVVLTGSRPLVETAHTRGGTWLRDDGVRECTGGWSVTGAGGSGIMTAGHCDGLNQFEEPGVAPYGMTFKGQSWLFGGDVEWHTTTHAEIDDFYSDATTIRDVADVRATNTMVGNTVCMYGRKSDVRTCNHTVEAVFVNVLADGNVPVGELARTTNNSADFGDSGGGWSFNFTAWGVTHGFDANGKSYFTTASEAESQISVAILK